MINEVDEALRSLMKAEVVNGTDVEIVFDAPTRDWASRRNKPTVDMYLYDIREDLKRRQAGMIERRNAQGIVEERKELPRFYKLSYLLTAWTQRPEDEHRLLSAILSCFVMHEIMPESHMPATLAGAGIPVSLQIAYPPPQDRQVSDVWASLGGDLKASMDLVVTLAILPRTLHEVAKAVMEPLRLRTYSRVTIEADDGVRYLRPSPAEPAVTEEGAETEDQPKTPRAKKATRDVGQQE